MFVACEQSKKVTKNGGEIISRYKALKSKPAIEAVIAPYKAN